MTTIHPPSLSRAPEPRAASLQRIEKIMSTEVQPNGVSVVVPLYNEQDSVAKLCERIGEALSDAPFSWELVLVDDGSTDRTWPELLKAAAARGSYLHPVRLQRNFGQSAAMQAGMDAARGEVIVTMDGDLQNDPLDIPAMVQRLMVEDLDLVAGWRKDRQDGLWMRKFPSRIANALIGWMTGVRLHDYGCTLKVFRARVVRHLRLYGEMHRFIPAWLAKYTSPHRIQEHVVRHHPRAYGQSKYGISRVVRVILDLLAVLFFMRYSARPGHVFGTLGLIFGAIGAVMLSYLLVLKLVGQDIGSRPMLMTGILLVVMAVQFLTAGVLSELLARIYYESGRTNDHAYIVGEVGPHGREWHGTNPEPSTAHGVGVGVDGSGN